jgi:hypothetical protein
MVARMSFRIADFRPGQYFLAAQVEAKGRTTDGTFPSAGYPVPDKEVGEAVLEFPLSYVWTLGDVPRPFTIWLFLLKRDDANPHKSAAVAVSGPVRYEVR